MRKVRNVGKLKVREEGVKVEWKGRRESGILDGREGGRDGE